MTKEISYQLSRIKGFISVIAIVVLIYGMKQAQSILVPLILALFLSSVVAYPMEWLIRKKVPKAIALTLVVVTVFGIIALIGTVVGNSINEFTQKTGIYEKNLTEWYNQTFIDHAAEDYGDSTEIAGVTSRDIIKQVASYISPTTLMNWSKFILTSLQNIFKNIFLILIAMIFMLIETGSFKYKLNLLSEANPETKKSVSKFMYGLWRYIGFKTLISLGTGIIITLWVSVLGLDFPLLWGLIAFLLNFIPTIGSIIASLPAILMALVQLGPGYAGLVAIGYFLTNVIIGNILEPRIMGYSLGLSTIVVFISLLFWGWVFGFTGMLLAVPLTMTVKIALESSKRSKNIAILMSSNREIMQRKTKIND
ncbi:AI-2E family transporter [bacterium]|nr:AI-2E family transporter [bacterium]